MPCLLPFLFPFKTLSLKPVILIPGLVASPLYGTVTGSNHWYCPNLRNRQVWINDLLFLPPFSYCLTDWTRLDWNPETQELVQPPYVNISPPPIGPLDNVLYVDSLFGSIHTTPTFSILANRLIASGYEKDKDLFGLPYDWRFGLWQPPAFWANVTSFIEKVVNETGKKAILTGHSMGGFLCHYFLSNKTTAEWRSQYIDSTVMIAPSFGGFGLAFRALWSKKLPFLSVLGQFNETMNTFGGIQIHMPNSEIYENTTVYIHSDGTKYSGSEIPKLLAERNALSADGLASLGHFVPFFEKIPGQLDVPVSIVYNSGIQTVLGVNESAGKEDWIFGPGDRLVNSETAAHVCKAWKNVTCLDLHTRWPTGGHIVMLWTKAVGDFVVGQVMAGQPTPVPSPTPALKEDL
jgi:pimeloyl-ACP methyl ester carboxylesterase